MKIITYGCSFTKYTYPSYADILANDYVVDNFGRSGCGNDYIHYNVLKDFRNNKLSKYNIIIVQWTAYTRYNYLNRHNQWMGMDGCIWDNYQNIPLWKTIRHIYNDRYEYDRQTNYIIGTKNTLDNLDATVIHMCLFKSNLNFMLHDNMLEKFRGNYEFSPTYFSKTNWVDDHPTVLDHLKIAESILDISKETVTKSKNLDLEIRRDKKFITKTL